MRTSYSALATFKQCPQKFKFQYIDKIKAPKGVQAVFGTSIHGSLKFMFSHDPLFPTLDQIISDFSENWARSSKNIFPELSPELKQVYEDAGKSMLKNFYKKNPPWGFGTVDTESHFEVLLSDPKNNQTHILAGIIDRIDKIGDGEYEIIDYKTSRRLPSQEAVDSDLQMSVYHMALTRRWPNLDPKKIKLSLYFLKHDEKISSQRTAESLLEIRESILKTIIDIEERTKKNSFPPVVSKLCDYCAFRPICPAWKHLYQKEKSPAPDENLLEEALSEYFSIKEADDKNSERLGELQAIIKAYMDAHGVERVFDANGFSVSRKLQQRFKYDFEKVKEILTAAGLEDKWQAILEADDKKLKAIMNSLPPHIRSAIADQKLLQKEFTVLTSSTKPVKK